MCECRGGGEGGEWVWVGGYTLCVGVVGGLCGCVYVCYMQYVHFPPMMPGEALKHFRVEVPVL